MLTRQSTRTPKYCHHKATGQGYVRLNGKVYYCGAFADPASKEKYWSLVRQWLVQGRQLVEHVLGSQSASTAGPSSTQVVSLAILASAYLEFADTYYRRKDGTPTEEPGCVRDALRPMLELYRALPADQFGPLKLQAVREQMIGLNWARRTINNHVGRIKRVFKWGVSRELVPAHVHQGLLTVSGLRRGRSGAKEPPPVKPVSDSFVDALKPYVSAQVWAITELLRLTGARCGEICLMRGQDIDTSGPIWIYKPCDHKNSYRGQEREIFLGPRAQEIVRQFLKPGRMDAWFFSPAEAEAARNQRRRCARRTPMTPSATARRARQRPQGDVGDRFDVSIYRRSVERGLEKAFPLPPELGLQLVPHPISGKSHLESRAAWWSRLTDEQKAQVRAWRKAHYFHPHQLRHSAATTIRREFGIETARVILGHTSIDTTTIYAEEDRKKAASAMLKLG